MTPYTTAELAAIVQRAEAATEGLWEDRGECVSARLTAHYEAEGFTVECSHTPICELRIEGSPNQKHDAAFIAAARTDVPRLAAEVIALRKALEPFAKAFAHRVADPALSEARRKHYTNMPGEWSVTLTVTMQDGRNACALLPPEPS